MTIVILSQDFTMSYTCLGIHRKAAQESLLMSRSNAGALKQQDVFTG
jgi:hypothetical protein